MADKGQTAGIKSLWIVLVALIVAGGAIAAGTVWQKTAEARYSDRQFIEEMVLHHSSAVAMADLAKQKAKTAEVQTLAAVIMAAQNREITEMRQWYQQWYGQGLPEMTVNQHGGGHSDEASLTALQNAADFDQEFLRQMIPHHEDAVRMANKVLPVTERQETRDLASSIIASQSAETRQMKGYLDKGFSPEAAKPHCDSVASC